MSQRGSLRRHSTRGGQALVEFALVFPVFLLILFGLVDVGRYVYVANALNQASREGARFGSVEQWQYSCPDDVATKNRFACTEAIALGRLSGAPANVTAGVTCWSIVTGGALQEVTDPASCRSRNLLRVEVRAVDYQFLTPGLGLLLGKPTISGQTQVAVE